MASTNNLPTTRLSMHSLVDELNRFLPKEFGRSFEGMQFDDDMLDGTWLPAVDVKEDAKSYTVTADIPGVDPKAVKVTLEDNVLSISGERSSEKKTEREGYRRVERCEGSFQRRFLLPEAADPEQVTAKCSQGVLTVQIPKAANHKVRSIPIAS